MRGEGGQEGSWALACAVVVVGGGGALTGSPETGDSSGELAAGRPFVRGQLEGDARCR
jgi:hypothetical protein